MSIRAGSFPSLIWSPEVVTSVNRLGNPISTVAIWWESVSLEPSVTGMTFVSDFPPRQLDPNRRLSFPRNHADPVLDLAGVMSPFRVDVIRAVLADRSDSPVVRRLVGRIEEDKTAIQRMAVIRDPS